MKGFSVSTMSLDLCPHCMLKKHRVGWLCSRDGGKPTCMKCKRVYGYKSTKPVPLEDVYDVLTKVLERTESKKVQAEVRRLRSKLNDICNQYC